jgi:hypothetical protein
MDKQEFFLLIPAIIYGVAIVDLLKIFSHKKNYIEMVGWGLFVMMAVIFSWIELYDKLAVITGNNINFFFTIFHSIIFAKAAAIITPEEKDVNTKEYYFNVRKSFFLLLTAMTIYGMLMQYFVYDDNSPSWLRPLAIVFYLISGLSNNYWFRIISLILVLILSVLRVFTDVLYY